jgi:hypothetical protein
MSQFPESGPSDHQGSRYGPGPEMYPTEYYGPPMIVLRTNGMAVAGLVLGILSVVLVWAPVLDLILPPLGIAFSIIGLTQCVRRHQPGKGMAIAGLVCSLLSAIFWTFIVIAVLLAF